MSTNPKAWKNGATAATGPSRSPVNAVLAWQICATTFRCVSITPLGRPLVPLE
jgi:hypothetical protein